MFPTITERTRSETEAALADAAKAYEDLLGKLLTLTSMPASREMSLVKTKLQEAYHWTRAAIELQP